MGYSLLAHTKAGNATTGGTSAGIDTTGVDFLVLVASYFGTITISDSKGNTWTARTEKDSGGVKQRLYYVQAPTVGSGHTFTVNGVGTFSSICVAGFSGSLASPYDVENGATGASVTSLATGSITPSLSQELLITGVGTEVAGTPTIDNGFTVTDTVAYVTGTTYECSLGYLVQSVAAAINPTWSFSSSLHVAAVIASFKSASGFMQQTQHVPSLRSGRW